MTKKKNPILDKLGLTREEVRAAFSVEAPEEKETEKNYLFRDQQKKMSRRMVFWENMVYARYMGGWHPKTIAKCLGVSEETVRVRLRKANFFN